MGRSMPTMQFQPRDFVADGARSFAIFQDEAKTKCVFAVDNGAAWVKFDHTQFAAESRCDEVLASGKLQKGDATYYLAMFKAGGRNQLGVISVNRSNKVAAEKALSAAALKSGPMGDMKTAKKAVTAAIP